MRPLRTLRPRLTYANVAATVALFAAVSTGGAWAATTLIGTAQVRNESLTGSDIKNGSIRGIDLSDRSVTSLDIADQNLTSADLQDESVGASEIRNGTISAADVRNGSLSGGDIKDGSIERADLATSARPRTGATGPAGPQGARGPAGPAAPGPEFRGTVDLPFTSVDNATCAEQTTPALTPTTSGASIADDVVSVTPVSLPAGLSVTTVLVPPNQFTVRLCNGTATTIATPGGVQLRYVAADVS